jgi:hypothetical protein
MRVRVPLFGGLLAALIFSATLVPAAAAPTTVAVDGQQPWTSTGLNVQAGQVIKVTATGRINYFNGEPQTEATPDGSVSGENHCGGPSLCGALIGRIAGGEAFAVGSEFKTTATVSGPLDLGINDFDDDPDGIFDNNSGSFTAEVEIDPPSLISGRVVDGDGHGIPDIRINAKGKAGLSDTTDFDGQYEIEVPGNKLGEYTVTPKGDCKKACRGGFDPKSRRLDVAAGDTATANFTGKCAGRKRSARAGFSPQHGLYGGAGLASVYYSCLSKTVRAARSVGNMSCENVDGALGPVDTVTPVSRYGLHGFPAGQTKLDGRSFKLKNSFARVEMIPGNQAPDDFQPLQGSLIVKINGEFAGSDRVDVRWSAVASGVKLPSSPTNTGPGGRCTETGKSKLLFAEPDPSPFDPTE